MKTVLSKTTEAVTLTAKISDDRLKLFIDVVPGSQDLITRDLLLSILSEIVPSDLVHTGVLDDIIEHLKRGEKVEERRIAKGQEPTPGLDGRQVFLVKRFSGDAELTQDPQGYVSFRDLHLFDNVPSGAVVARIYPPKNGIDGKDALGKAIPAKPGKPIKPNVDKTILIQPSDQPGEDFQRLVAQVDGYLAEESGRLGIRTEMVIKDNVDFHWGNISFIGSVLVKKDVKQGFQVQAQKDITIMGSVENATALAPNGSIAIKGGVYGLQSKIVGGNEVSCSVARQATIESRSNIHITKEALDCMVRTQASLFIPQGSLVGGKTFAVCGVEAKRIGNDAGKPTIIWVCSDVEMTTEYSTLMVAIESHRKALSLVDLHLGPYALNRARVTLLKSPHRERMQQLLAKRDEIDRSLIKLLAKKMQMLESAQLNTTIRVNYLETLYEGVTVKAGEHEFVNKEVRKGPGTIEFDIKTGTFEVVTPARPLECVVSFGTKPENEKKNSTVEKKV